MSTTSGDTSTDVTDALIAVLEGDTILRGLVGRTSKFVVPYDDNLTKDRPMPVLAFRLVDGAEANSGATMGSERYVIQFSVFGRTQREANAICYRLPACCTWNAFHALDFTPPHDMCLDPAAGYRRTWPPHSPAKESPAKARADVRITLLVKPA